PASRRSSMGPDHGALFLMASALAGSMPAGPARFPIARAQGSRGGAPPPADLAPLVIEPRPSGPAGSLGQRRALAARTRRSSRAPPAPDSPHRRSPRLS